MMMTCLILWIPGSSFASDTLVGVSLPALAVPPTAMAMPSATAIKAFAARRDLIHLPGVLAGTVSAVSVGRRIPGRALDKGKRQVPDIGESCGIASLTGSPSIDVAISLGASNCSPAGDHDLL